MPGVPPGRRLAGLVRAAGFYALWYPGRWLGWSGWPRYAAFGPLARHLRWVGTTARRLARAQFHLMVANGPALEKKQAQLFRCVDIGAELFAMAATCVRAQRDRARGAEHASCVELADGFCRNSRRRVEALFSALQWNDDATGYAIARGLLDERHAWLEEGIVHAETRGTGAAADETPRRGAAAGG
jgi:hypothetical protein